MLRTRRSTGWVRYLQMASAVGFVAAVTACGGGGGGGDPVPVPVAPSITSQPVSQTVQAGQSASFSVAASGDAPLSYQWLRGGTDVPGATSTTYTVASAQVSDSGSVWTARATNPAGTVVSVSATLTVMAAPVVGTVTLLAGDLNQMGALDGQGNAARFNRPHGLALDPSGNVLVADLFNHTIRMIQPDGTVSTLAGMAGVNGTADGSGSAARFQRPIGLAMGGDGLVYVIDGWELFPLTLRWHSIRTVTLQGQVGTAYSTALSPAGIATGANGDVYGYAQNGLTLFSRTNPPTVLASVSGGQFSGALFSGALARDASGNLYYLLGNSIQKRAPDGTTTTFAGSITELGSADGTGTNARFGFGTLFASGDQVAGYFAVDAAGNLFVSDTRNHTIRKVTPAGVVTTVVGKAGVAGTVLGPVPNAGLNLPQGIAVVNEKLLYVVSGQAVLKVVLP